jgi:predicted DNA-binding transcriptional regulator AlpA
MIARLSIAIQGSASHRGTKLLMFWLKLNLNRKGFGMDSKRNELINQKELAARLGVADRTIKRWRSRKLKGMPPPIKDGPGEILWSKAMIDDWVEIATADTSGQQRTSH